jgi:hypothetical protein
MEHLDQVIHTISMAMGASWASGINLYATLLVLGIGQNMGALALPPDLMILSDPLVIMAAGLMYGVEFFADKVPGVDTAWDSIHTFIRIPAGALLAFGMTGEVNPPAALAAAIVGGAIAAGTHATKAGTRVMINASPEPFSNWTASILEDVLAVTGLWTALNHPYLFTLLLIFFIFFMIWFLPKIWKGIKKLFSFIGRLLGISPPPGDIGDEAQRIRNPSENRGSTPGPNDIEQKLAKLNDLLEKGLITPDEYSRKKTDHPGFVLGETHFPPYRDRQKPRRSFWIIMTRPRPSDAAEPPGPGFSGDRNEGLFPWHLRRYPVFQHTRRNTPA